MSDWRKIKLGDLGTIITGKTPFKNNSEDWGDESLFITPSDYGNYRKWANNSIRKLSAEGERKLSKKILPKGSILVTCIGSDMGKVVMNGRSAITNQQINSIVPNTNIVNPDFAYYLLVDLYETLRIYGGDGTAVPIVNKSDFENIDTLIPKKEEQAAIASILSSLDDKIDLLHRQNQTLEQMAETLFRQWFVEEADDDWEEVTLKSLCKIITKGTTPTSLKKKFVDVGVNFIKVNCIDENGNFLYDKFNYIDEDTHNVTLKRSILEEGDLLYSIAGTIGRISEVTREVLPANVNQALAILRVNKEVINPYYVKYSLKDPNITFELHSKIVHAVQPNLSLGEIGSTLIPKPDLESRQKFNEIINPIEAKIKSNQSQIRTLIALRDKLLPKLMNGSVRV